MIDIKELRIGNYLYNNDLVVKIDARSIFDIWDNKGLKTYKPILLTESWLIMFGLEKYEFDNKENQYRFKYNFKDRLIVVRHGKFIDYGSSVVLEYVHTFQNFIFALTKQDLEIKK
jgi:hypothetical protein